MKAIKVLFAVLLTASLGLITSCGGGGGGGGGGSSSSSDLAPDSIVGKTMTIYGRNATTNAVATQSVQFISNSSALFTTTTGTSYSCDYTYLKRSSARANIVLSYNTDAHLLSNPYWQNTYELSFSSKDEATAQYSSVGGRIDANGNKTGATNSANKYDVTFE